MISIQCQLRNLHSIEITAFSSVLFIFFSTILNPYAVEQQYIIFSAGMLHNL